MTERRSCQVIRHSAWSEEKPQKRTFYRRAAPMSWPARGGIPDAWISDRGDGSACCSALRKGARPVSGLARVRRRRCIGRLRRDPADREACIGFVAVPLTAIFVVLKSRREHVVVNGDRASGASSRRVSNSDSSLQTTPSSSSRRCGNPPICVCPEPARTAVASALRAVGRGVGARSVSTAALRYLRRQVCPSEARSLPARVSPSASFVVFRRRARSLTPLCELRRRHRPDDRPGKHCKLTGLGVKRLFPVY